jgi:hypothetical protein
VGDDAHASALAVAGEVALDVDGGAGRELGEVGGVAGGKDDPVAVYPVAGGVALGDEEEADLAVTADRSWDARHQADEACLVHWTSASISSSVKSWSMMILLASVKAAAWSW